MKILLAQVKWQIKTDNQIKRLHQRCRNCKFFQLAAIAAIVTLTGNVHCKPTPDVGSAEAGYQYDAANEYNLGQYEPPAYDAASSFATTTNNDDDDSGSSSSSIEYDDYPANIGQQRRRRADTPPPSSATGGAPAVVAEPDDSRRLATVALSDLVGAVEHTLIHSAQKLAESNATAEVGAFNSTETSTVIALPIRLPEETTSTTTAEPELAGTVLAVVPSDSLPLLSVIAVSPAAIDDDEEITTERTQLIAIGDHGVDNAQNITIIQTINSTQVHEASTDVNGDQRPEHVQQQHITLFSAGAGIFPNIPSVQLDDPVVASNRSETLNADSASESDEQNEPDENDCSESGGEEDSAESTEVTATSSETPSADKKAQAERLKEKIAEVEAEPVILTQGI